MDKATFIRKKAFAHKLRTHETPAERALHKCLSKKQLRTRFYAQKIICGWIVDFYAPDYKLIIELDGSVHWQEQQAKKDRIKDRSLEAKGYRVMRFSNQQVIEDVESVLTKIRIAMNEYAKKLKPPVEQRAYSYDELINSVG